MLLPVTFYFIRQRCVGYVQHCTFMNVKNNEAIAKAITKTRLRGKRDFCVFPVFRVYAEKSRFFGKIAFYA